MDTNKKIAKAMLNKNFVEAKELVFKSLYAKASLAMDEARYDVANSVFNEDKKMGMYSHDSEEDKKTEKKKGKNEKPSMYEASEQLDEVSPPDTGVPAGASEDKFKAARDTVKKAGYKAKLGKGVPAGAMKEEAELDEMAQTDGRKQQIRDKLIGDRGGANAYDPGNPNHWAKINRLVRADKKEKKSPFLYGRDGKIVSRKRKPVKEETEQLDEVSPPDMEKMTGSKKTKASFAKQYGKRGKSVMYATAWKLHNKKAGKD
jgi:hypothetical protein